MSERKETYDAEHATPGDKSASMQRMISQLIELQRQNARLQREIAALQRRLDTSEVRRSVDDALVGAEDEA